MSGAVLTDVGPHLLRLGKMKKPFRAMTERLSQPFDEDDRCRRPRNWILAGLGNCKCQYDSVIVWHASTPTSPGQGSPSSRPSSATPAIRRSGARSCWRRPRPWLVRCRYRLLILYRVASAITNSIRSASVEKVAHLVSCSEIACRPTPPAHFSPPFPRSLCSGSLNFGDLRPKAEGGDCCGNEAAIANGPSRGGVFIHALIKSDTFWDVLVQEIFHKLRGSRSSRPC
jgi:hypothetical protein